MVCSLYFTHCTHQKLISLILELLYYNQDVPFVSVMCPTEKFNHTYRDVIPPMFIHDFNKDSLKQFIHRQEFISEYSDVFSDQLKHSISSEPIKLELKPDAKLTAKFTKIGQKIQSKKVYIYECFATFIYNKNFSHSLLLYKKMEKKFAAIKSFKHSSNSLTRESTQHKENLQQHEIRQREE